MYPVLRHDLATMIALLLKVLVSEPAAANIMVGPACRQGFVRCDQIVCLILTFRIKVAQHTANNFELFPCPLSSRAIPAVDAPL